MTTPKLLYLAVGDTWKLGAQQLGDRVFVGIESGEAVLAVPLTLAEAALLGAALIEAASLQPQAPAAEAM